MDNIHTEWQELTIKDVNYPQKLKQYLKNTAPTILFYKGNLDLLKHKIVSFCGSREVLYKGIPLTENCVQQIIKKDIVIISGYARGIDTYAHKAALKAGGSTIIVIPYGWKSFEIKQTLQKYWNWEKILIISQFHPDSKWTIENAMTRNKTIVALSDAVVIIQAKATGGSIHAGLTALKMNKPLYVPVYKNKTFFNEGNDILIKKGARKISRNKNSQNPYQANLTHLFRQLKI